jgi:hypothetical protein
MSKWTLIIISLLVFISALAVINSVTLKNETTLSSDCPSGQIDCYGICTDLQSNTQNCGSCSNDCDSLGSNFQCQQGLCKCPSGLSCLCKGGDCSVGANQWCTVGGCQCGYGLTWCSDGTCHDLETDDNNCGQCGLVCLNGGTCRNGICE